MARLRTVAPGERPPRRRSPRSVATAASSGTTRDLLVQLRARVATAIDDPATPARDLAALTRRMQEIVRDIDALDAREKQEATSGAEVEDGEFDASTV